MAREMTLTQQDLSQRFEQINISGEARVHMGDVHNTTHNYSVAAERATKPLCTIPFVRDPDYVHRGPLFDEIHDKLSAPGARVALVGIGGVGKSQLAIEYGHYVREKSPSTWVLWLHASSSQRLEQSVRDTLEQLKVPGATPNGNVFHLLQSWLRDVEHGKWLIILDNVDDVNVLLDVPSSSGQNTSSSQQIRFPERCLDYLPSSSHGSILVTSRSREAALRLVERKAVVAIDPMDEYHAVQLVGTKLTTAHTEGDAVQLVRALDFMPLAISQAAAYIDQSPHCSVTRYLERLHKSDKSWQNLLKYDTLDLRRDKDAKHSTLLTLQVSFDRIYEYRRSAADLLSLMSMFDRQSIPVSLICDWSRLDRISDKSKPKRHFRIAISDWTRRATSRRRPRPEMKTSETRTDAATTEHHGFNEDLKTLLNYSLITVTAEAMVFRMHRLVQLSIQAWLETCGRLEQWKCCFISNLNDDMTNERPVNAEDQAKGRQIYVHTLEAIKIELDSNNAKLEQASLLYKSGVFALHIGDYANAANMLTRSINLETALKNDGHRHPEDAAYYLIHAYIAQWRVDEAEQLQTEELRAVMRSYGPYHERTLWNKNGLARIYSDKGQLKEAEELQAEILETAKQTLGHEDQTTITFMGNLARVYYNQGRLQEAEKLQVKALRAMELSRAEESLKLTCMNELAGNYEQQGRLQEAEELYVKAIAASTRSLGDIHPVTLEIMTALASTYQRMGRWQSSSYLIELCAAMSESVLGRDDPGTIERFRLKEKWEKERTCKSDGLATSEPAVGAGNIER